jgi:hypothetical protein
MRKEKDLLINFKAIVTFLETVMTMTRMRAEIIGIEGRAKWINM